jgi:hypothetical protein
MGKVGKEGMMITYGQQNDMVTIHILVFTVVIGLGHTIDQARYSFKIINYWFFYTIIGKTAVNFLFS